MPRVIAMLLLDLLLIAVATILALILRDNLVLMPSRLIELLPYLALTLALGTPVLLLLGLNRAIWRLSVMSDYSLVACAAVVIVVGVVAVDFAIERVDETARSLPILQSILIGLLMIGARALTRQRYLWRRRGPEGAELSSPAYRTETVLIAGINRIAELYLQTVAEFAPDRIKIAGILGRSVRHTGRLMHRQKVLGTPEDALTVLKTLEIHGVSVDRIVVTAPFYRLSPEAQAALLTIEETTNVKLDLFAERTCYEDIGYGRDRRLKETRAVTARKEFSFSHSAEEAVCKTRRFYWRTKRIIDFVTSGCLIIFLAPLWLAVALIVAIDLGPNIIFWQQRPGLGGRPFKLFKFRTMRAAYDAAGSRIPDESRVSWIGQFLRRSRLDELPQLYNILKGEMSFVGPRPLLSTEQPEACEARLVLRPGLTGWAQIKGGREIAALDKAALDAWYFRNASFLLDLGILIHTLPIVLFGERVSGQAIGQAWRELREPSTLLSGSLTTLSNGNNSSAVLPRTTQAA